MRILLVSGAAYPSIGGIENSLNFIGKELLIAGHEVKIFCFQISPDEPLRHEHEGIEIVRCDKYVPSRWPPTRLKRFVNLTRLHIRPLLEEFHPDEVWSRYAPTGLGVAQSGFQGKIIHIFATTAGLKCRGSYLHRSWMPVKKQFRSLVAWPWNYRTSWRIDYELLKRCHPVVFSQNMRRQLQKSYGILAEKTQVIRPGVDRSWFSRERGLRQLDTIRSQCGLDVNEPIILFVGRLAEEKHIPYLIEAFKYVRQPTRVVLVGRGQEEKRLRDFVGRCNLSDRVTFAGQQHELLPGFYTMAKVCVLPTMIESFGQTLLESLSCGTPVVGFAANGRRVINAIDEIVQDGKTGRIVREITAKGLADGINNILTLSPAEYQAMSEQGVADVTQRFSWKRFVEELLAI